MDTAPGGMAATSGGGTANGNAGSSGGAGTDAIGGRVGGGGMAEGETAGGGDAAGGSDAAGGHGPAIPETLPLARACSDDSECGPWLTCVSADENFEGLDGSPARGLCTKACETNADCQALDHLGVCGSLTEPPLVSTGGEPRVCLLSCGLGANGELKKCEGRTDLACSPLAGSDSVQCDDGKCPSGSVCQRIHCRRLACSPRCNADSDCNAGRYCDPFSGLCTETDPDPVPLGLECKDPTDTLTCGGGNCEVLYKGQIRVKGMCTQSCTFGERCGEGEGACVMHRFTESGAGDTAYCQPLCNCNSDCRNPKDLCHAWDGFIEAFGSRGYCDLPQRGLQTLDCAGEEGGAGGRSSSQGGAGGSP